MIRFRHRFQDFAVRLGLHIPIPENLLLDDQDALRIRALRVFNKVPNAARLRRKISRGECWNQLSLAATRIASEDLIDGLESLLGGGERARKGAELINGLVRFELVDPKTLQPDSTPNLLSLVNHHLEALGGPLSAWQPEGIRFVSFNAIDDYKDDCDALAIRRLVEEDVNVAAGYARKAFWLSQLDDITHDLSRDAVIVPALPQRKHRYDVSAIEAALAAYIAACERPAGFEKVMAVVAPLIDIVRMGVVPIGPIGGEFGILTAA